VITLRDFSCIISLTKNDQLQKKISPWYKKVSNITTKCFEQKCLNQKRNKKHHLKWSLPEQHLTETVMREEKKLEKSFWKIFWNIRHYPSPPWGRHPTWCPSAPPTRAAIAGCAKTSGSRRPATVTWPPSRVPLARTVRFWSPITKPRVLAESLYLLWRRLLKR